MLEEAEVEQFSSPEQGRFHLPFGSDTQFGSSVARQRRPCGKGWQRSKTVCVTGATGFIASWLVKTLLERGYTVKGTIRDPERAKYLMLLPGANERLQLVKADLLQQGSFDSVVQGCDGVFHTASPVLPYQQDIDPQTQLLDPAINGTLNVLESCAKAKGVKRIVLTSSVGAIAYKQSKTVDNLLLDESSWSDVDYLYNSKQWYPLSKTLAEKAAWEFAKEHNLDMVVITPSGVFGPILQDSITSSNQIFVDILNGTMKVYPNSMIGQVGVIDAVMAHILVYENPEAEGRYICTERVTHFSDFVSMLAKLYPEYHIVAKQADEAPRFSPYRLSSEKIKKLGLTFQPMEDVIHEAVACFKRLKLI